MEKQWTLIIKAKPQHGSLLPTLLPTVCSQTAHVLARGPPFWSAQRCKCHKLTLTFNGQTSQMSASLASSAHSPTDYNARIRIKNPHVSTSLQKASHSSHGTYLIKWFTEENRGTIQQQKACHVLKKSFHCCSLSFGSCVLVPTRLGYTVYATAEIKPLW